MNTPAFRPTWSKLGSRLSHLPSSSILTWLYRSTSSLNITGLFDIELMWSRGPPQPEPREVGTLPKTKKYTRSRYSRCPTTVIRHTRLIPMFEGTAVSLTRTYSGLRWQYVAAPTSSNTTTNGSETIRLSPGPTRAGRSNHTSVCRITCFGWHRHRTHIIGILFGTRLIRSRAGRRNTLGPVPTRPGE